MLKSVLAIARQRSHEKFAILTLKPRSHVKILIYRTWAIPPSSPIMASEADLRLLSRAALAWLLATPRMESFLVGYVASETRPCCCCWVLFGKRLLKLTFSFYQSSCLTKSFPGFQWDIFCRVAGNLQVGRWLRHLLPKAAALGDKSWSPWKAGLVNEILSAVGHDNRTDKILKNYYFEAAIFIESHLNLFPAVFWDVRLNRGAGGVHTLS